MLFAQRWPWPGRAEPCPCQIVLCSPPAASCGPSTQYTVIKNLNVGTSRKCKKAKILPDRLQALARRLLPVAAAAESRRPTRQKKLTRCNVYTFNRVSGKIRQGYRDDNVCSAFSYPKCFKIGFLAVSHVKITG
jgi:hypothetical protein